MELMEQKLSTERSSAAAGMSSGSVLYLLIQQRSLLTGDIALIQSVLKEC